MRLVCVRLRRRSRLRTVALVRHPAERPFDSGESNETALSHQISCVLRVRSLLRCRSLSSLGRAFGRSQVGFVSRRCAHSTNKPRPSRPARFPWDGKSAGCGPPGLLSRDYDPNDFARPLLKIKPLALLDLSSLPLAIVDAHRQRNRSLTFHRQHSSPLEPVLFPTLLAFVSLGRLDAVCASFAADYAALRSKGSASKSCTLLASRFASDPLFVRIMTFRPLPGCRLRETRTLHSRSCSSLRFSRATTFARGALRPRGRATAWRTCGISFSSRFARLKRKRISSQRSLELRPKSPCSSSLPRSPMLVGWWGKP